MVRNVCQVGVFRRVVPEFVKREWQVEVRIKVQKLNLVKYQVLVVNVVNIAESLSIVGISGNQDNRQ